MYRHVDVADLLTQLAIPIPTATILPMVTYCLQQHTRSGVDLQNCRLVAVGHRVVYVGNESKASLLSTLHKTSAVQELEVTRKWPHSIPRIVVFAIVFFHDL